MNEEREPGKVNLNYPEVVKKWLDAYEGGDPTIIPRIQQTLLIDGMSKPSLNDIKNFLGKRTKKTEDHA